MYDGWTWLGWLGELDTWFNGGDGGVGSAIMSLFTCFIFSSTSPLGNAVPKSPSSSLSSAGRFLDCSFTLSFSLGFRIASLAVFERLSAFFARKAWQRGQNCISPRQEWWKECEQPSNIFPDRSSFMLHPGKSHRLLWSGMVLVQYTRGKTLILTGSSPNILGNNTFVVLPWVEIFAFPGFLAIPVNMFARMFVRLAFSLLRLLSDHCGFLGWVKCFFKVLLFHFWLEHNFGFLLYNVQLCHGCWF